MPPDFAEVYERLGHNASATARHYSKHKSMILKWVREQGLAVSPEGSPRESTWRKGLPWKKSGVGRELPRWGQNDL